MLYGASRVASRGSLFVASLVLLFLVSFSLPLLFTFKFGGFFATPSTASDVDALFPESHPISGAGHFLRIAPAPDLNPQPGSDFILSAWFKLNRPPQVREKIVLLERMDADPAKPNGYILGVARESESLRPFVFWGDGEKGKWYSFADVPVLVQTWFMFALSFQEDKFLGLHMATVGANGKVEVQLLGGYAVEEPTLPSSTRPLLLGAWDEGRFRGRIGPFGIVSKPELGEDLKPVLKQIAREPLEFPADLSRRDLKLFVPRGLEDKAMTPHEVRYIGGRRQSN